MIQEDKERRENKRVFFTMEEKIGASAHPPGDPGKPIQATLLSLSAGGLSIAAAKKQRKNIQEGDVLAISGLHLPGTYEAIVRIEVEVKYILFFKEYDVITIGGAFKNISGPDKEKIEAFIDERMKLLEEDEEGFEV